MSFFRKLIPKEIRGVVSAVLPGLTASIPGIGPALTAIGVPQAIGASLTRQPAPATLPVQAAQAIARRPALSAAITATALPALGAVRLGGAGMSALGGLGGLTMRGVGFGAGALVGGVVRSARSIANAAMGYCRRNPGWCASIGGLAAVQALVEDGSLPIPRRRRGRGLTPRDLRSFRRVATLIRGFCPTVRRVPTRALRGRVHHAVDV